MSEVVLVEVSDRIGTVTLNRPEVRRELPKAMLALDGNDDVDVVILTGADPAFCAGLDLKELGSRGTRQPGDPDPVVGGPFPVMTKPVIGAINGVAITGG